VNWSTDQTCVPGKRDRDGQPAAQDAPWGRQRSSGTPRARAVQGEKKNRGETQTDAGRSLPLFTKGTSLGAWYEWYDVGHAWR